MKVKNKCELEKFVTDNFNQINLYLDKKMENLPVPFYASVDIRESRDKFAPVDNNLYPAGFNNICGFDLKNAIPQVKETLIKYQASAKVIGILPESNTKNLFYLDHLHTLKTLIENAGYEVVIFSFDNQLFAEQKTLTLTSQSSHTILIHQGELIQKEIFADKKKMNLVILNHDQSSPLPVDWEQIATPVHPSPFIGWYRRQKVTHFKFYKQVADELCTHFSINPELIQAKFRAVDEVDFSSKNGFEKLATEVDGLLKELPADSSVFVKASQGTYGMGISVVKSGDEILQMNRKDRNKMDIGKNKIKFTTVLAQEGVETILKYDDMPAEVTIYLIDGKCVGGFMRANSERGPISNLNSRGMVFKKLCISELSTIFKDPANSCGNQDHKSQEAIYTIMARLSTLASALEIAQTK